MGLYNDKRKHSVGEYRSDSGETDELGDTWLKLLGRHSAQTHPAILSPAERVAAGAATCDQAGRKEKAEEQASAEMALPPGSSSDNPWFELLQAQGAAVVDLQHECLNDIRVLLTEQEVEQALQILQEQHTSGKDSG